MRRKEDSTTVLIMRIFNEFIHTGTGHILITESGVLLI
jgi:hypothetical protein